jgi:hypothetical protein
VGSVIPSPISAYSLVRPHFFFLASKLLPSTTNYRGMFHLLWTRSLLEECTLVSSLLRTFSLLFAIVTTHPTNLLITIHYYYHPPNYFTMSGGMPRFDLLPWQDIPYYCVPGPNYIWSVDGHMKLELFGTEIYAGVDAYSRGKARGRNPKCPRRGAPTKVFRPH